MIWKALLISISMLWMSPEEHGIYIAVIEINHNDLSKGQVIIKSFSDDLANALRAMNFNIALDINPCEEQDFLADYIDQHLDIKMDGNTLNLQINKCVIESDTHWIYIDFDQNGSFKKVEIESDWMTELFGNQQNIIKVNLGNRKRNDRLSAKKTKTTLLF